MQQNTLPRNQILLERQLFENLCDNNLTLIFFNKQREWSKHQKKYEDLWFPESLNIYATFDSFTPNTRNHNVQLIFLKHKEIPEYTYNYEIVDFEYFNPQNIKHIHTLFSLVIKKIKEANDFHCHRDLLFVLNNYFLDEQVLKTALDSLNRDESFDKLLKAIYETSICVAYPKQRLLMRVLSNYNYNYTIKVNEKIAEALQICYPKYKPDNDWYSNLFQLIEYAVNPNTSPKNHSCEFNLSTEQDNTNPFLLIRRWLLDGDFKFDNYEVLNKFIRFCPYNIQFLLLRRYFYGIYKNQNKFNPDVLKFFKNNIFDKWLIYQHASINGSAPLPIGLYLLCDSILTYINSNGQRFQGIKGILDLAYSKCDKRHPSVDFELSKIIPSCNGGAISKRGVFKGFVNFKLLGTINESRIQDISFTKKLFMLILKKIGNKLDDKRWEVTFDDGGDEKFIELLNIFLKKPLVLQSHSDINTRNADEIANSKYITVVIDNNEINNNVDIICSRLKEFIDFNLVKENNLYHIKSFDEVYDLIVENILEPKSMHISLREDIFLGLGVIADKIGRTKNDYETKECLNELHKLEAHYIKVSIQDYLKSEFGLSFNSSDYIICNYDEQLCSKLKAVFYISKNNEITKEFNFASNFLEKGREISYSCAPEFQNDINPLFHLPFFTCRGKECYRNSLEGQTINEDTSWEDYNILHMLEIINLPQIKKTQAGNEPSKNIRIFIAFVNKANAIFKRIKCRECGHILFPVDKSTLNIYNRYKCENISCTAYGKIIYLSHCHECKKGFIDSRDSAKCPNGWHICPNCLACCNDDLIQFQAQKFISRGRPIPEYINKNIKHGHNNKNSYFCPKCGNETIQKRIIIEKKSKIVRYCIKCKSFFDK